MIFLKNMCLIAVSIFLSQLTAKWFGVLYDKLAPSIGSAPIGSPYVWQGIIGGPFAFIFFTIFLFKLFGWGDKNKWIIWLLVLPALFFGSGDLRHIYLPIILGLIAYGLAVLLRKFFIKQPPAIQA